MEKEQIIKALECWASRSPCHEKCPILEHEEGANCIGLTTRSALALIKELTIELDAMRGAANSYKMHNERLTEENERLKAEVSVKKKLLDKCVDLEDRVKVDTVREMQERFKELIHTVPTVYNSHFRKLVAQVVERMLNEQQ